MSETKPESDPTGLHSLFFSPGTSRLRAGWRFLLQNLILLLVGGCLSIPLFVVLLLVDPTLLSTYPVLKPEELLLTVIGETLAVTLSVFLARRFLDKKPMESLGLQLNLQSLVDILSGIGIVLLQIGLIFFLMSRLGWISFEGFAWQIDPVGIVIKNTLLFLITFILVGWNEELLSRGYHLQTIASGTNLFWGVVISSAIFGVLHIANPGATWVSTVGVFFAGVYLAYGYIRTRQLWLSIGLHIGWNFSEGVIFGFPVSGLDIYALTRIKIQGPEAWTGGAFGPEAGLIVLPSLMLGVLLIYFYTNSRSG